MTRPYFLNPQNEEDLQWKTTSKILKMEYLCTNCDYEFLVGNLRKTQRKSRVWFCSAQLVFLYLSLDSHLLNYRKTLFWISEIHSIKLKGATLQKLKLLIHINSCTGLPCLQIFSISAHAPLHFSWGMLSLA